MSPGPSLDQSPSVRELLFGNLDPRAVRSMWRSAKGGSQRTSESRQSIGISASFTADPLVTYLGGILSALGSTVDMRLADYNQLMQTCLNPSDVFSGEVPDTIILLFRLEDLASDGKMLSIRDAFIGLRGAIEQLRKNFSGIIILSVPPRPVVSADLQASFARPSQSEAVWLQTFSEIAGLADSLDQVFTVDLESIIASLGVAASRDVRTEMMYRKPFTEPFYVGLAQRLARILRVQRQASKKCLVLDCDNTLWGGVIGDDGLSGIALSDDFPGRSYREFQNACRALKESGIFLAISSKNELSNVIEVFQKHSAMLLREADISVFSVNWEPKSSNLRSISEQLNIGLDSLVFVDDSIFEIEEVRRHCPEVTCLQVPSELAELPTLLHRHAYLFDRLVITGDDLERVNRMGGEQLRQQLSASLDATSFLKSLELRVSVFEPRTADFARVAQLVNKTNQFNTTTRRYTQNEIQALAERDDCRLYAMTVSDRFGDYGLVGVAIATRSKPEQWILDTFLMSCRVLKRGAETCLLSGVSLDLASLGARQLFAYHTPTAKNAMCANVFIEHGFSLVPEEKAPPFENGEGTRSFAFDLDCGIAAPEFVTFQCTIGSTADGASS